MLWLDDRALPRCSAARFREAPGRRYQVVKALAAAMMVVGLAVASAPAFGQEHAGSEPSHDLVLEIGAVAEAGLGDGKASFGPSFALAVTPIEHQLEIEFGLAPMVNNGSTEWEGEIVFKRPFELSDNVELLVGVGPEWATPSSSFGAVAKLDLVYWTTPQYGWFVEQSYSYGFNHDHEQNLTLKVGLLVALSSLPK